MPQDSSGINWTGVLGRIAAAAVLVFATFNPYGC